MAALTDSPYIYYTTTSNAFLPEMKFTRNYTEYGFPKALKSAVPEPRKVTALDRLHDRVEATCAKARIAA